MSDSPRAKAAAAIKTAHQPASAAPKPASQTGASVTMKNLSFTLDEEQTKWLADVNADTERKLDPSSGT